MLTRRTASAGLASSAILAATLSVAATNSTVRELPPPRSEGGKPLNRLSRYYGADATSDLKRRGLSWSHVRQHNLWPLKKTRRNTG
jgi:hypothetical protein